MSKKSLVMFLLGCAGAALVTSSKKNRRGFRPPSAGSGCGSADQDQESPIGLGHPSEWHLPNIEDLPPALGYPKVGGKKESVWKIVYPLNDPRYSPEYRGVPLAPPILDAVWPVNSENPMRLATSYLNVDGWYGYSGRAFKRDRKDDDGTERWHAGVDLFGYEGDEVVAPEDAKILTILPFHHGTSAVYLITGDRRVINLGEVAKGSWNEFGIKPGDNVMKGDSLARIGRQTYGSTMIHLEIYDASGISDTEMVDMIRNGEFRWLVDHPVPERLYDPTAYLLTAASNTYKNESAVVT